MHRQDCRFFYSQTSVRIDGFGGVRRDYCRRAPDYFDAHGCDECPWYEVIPVSKATFKARKRKFKRDLKLQFKRER